ncbi:MAG TPA: FtsX-like permease family protein [Terriglobia bacterium]|nr:FtsX-like permease family protein [Terriglobia bacterium]
MRFRRLVQANLFRKKARLLLTIGSFTVALFLFAFLAVVREAFTRGGGIASASRLVVINRVSLIQPLPLSYRDKISALKGVEAVTHNNWFGGVYQDPKNFFPQFVIDPENQRTVMPELIVSDGQWNTFLKDQQGAIVGARTAERFGWKVGDRISIKSPAYFGGQAWQFNIDGIYHGERRTDDESQFWFQWKYFEQNVPPNFKDMVGWYVVKLESPDDALRVSKAIDAEFANSPYETKTDTESQFAASWVNQMGNIKFLILSIGSVVFFTLLLVTGNTMAISVRERTAELAILKAIGFKDGTVLLLVLTEALAIAFVGAVLGLALATLAIPVLGAALNGLLPNLILSNSMIAAGVGFALATGVISGLLPGIGAMRLRVVDALRRI